ncbi:MAG: hypothetical protein QHI38_09100 [Armatimonadota bacterium]|nr:hypothetical protein [Armatimonadota bacterium]
MNAKRALAVELLMNYPDWVVAEMVGVRLKTLQGWMKMPDFAEALREREKDQARSVSRLARQAALKAAAALCEVNGGTAKPDPKILLETLKLSGAFEEPVQDPADVLGELVNRALAASGEETADA